MVSRVSSVVQGGAHPLDRLCVSILKIPNPKCFLSYSEGCTPPWTLCHYFAACKICMRHKVRPVLVRSFRGQVPLQRCILPEQNPGSSPAGLAEIVLSSGHISSYIHLLVDGPVCCSCLRIKSGVEFKGSAACGTVSQLGGLWFDFWTQHAHESRIC